MTDGRNGTEPGRANKLKSAGILTAAVAALVVLVFSLGNGSTNPAAPASPATTASTAPPATSRPPTTATATQRLNAALAAGGSIFVVDADTIEITNPDTYESTTVSIIGIDAPNTYAAPSGRQCWGTQAAGWARDKLTAAGVTVTLHEDPRLPSRDRFGRLQRYVVFPGGGNYSVLAAQAGVVRAAEPHGARPAAMDEIEAAAQQAQTTDRGLWGQPCNGSTAAPEPSYAPAPAGGDSDVELDLDDDNHVGRNLIGNGRDDIPFWPG